MIKVAAPSVGQEEIDAVTEVIKSGNYVAGKRVKAFEEAFAEYIGVQHAVAVSNGTDALINALFGAQVRPGNEVIVPPLTFFATVASVIHVGARPVFADIDPDTYCLDPESVREVLTERTAAILPVHIYGNVAEMDELNEIIYEEYDSRDVLRRRHKPYVIEDAAQAHGAEYKGRKAGSLGDASCFSFYATKNMTTIEEGGMVTTNDGRIAKYVEVLRNHGMINRNDHMYVGANNRLGEIGGAVGLIQLRKLDAMNAKRSANSEYLDVGLSSLGLPWLKLPTVKPYVKHAWFWYPILIDEDALGMSTLDFRDFLKEAGIETRHRYVEPLYKQPALMPYGKHYAELNLPNAEKICGRMLGLPNHQRLSRQELDYIIEVFKELK